MATRDYSDLQEKQIAKFLGGTTQSNSGGTRFGGGDVLTKDFLIEAKTPTKDRTSISVQKEWILKAREQAFEQNKSFGAVAIRFEPDGEDFYIISQTLFRYLLDTIEEED